jgi:type IV pilus assembly protein PilW
MSRRRRVRQWGLTLIEMMVAIVVGSLLIVAVLIVLAGGVSRPGAEGGRRTTGSNADIDQSSAIAMFQLDKWVRSAGTGIAQTVQSLAATYSYAYGCELFASKSGTQLLPVPSSTMPSPFNGSTFIPSGTASTGIFRLLPVLIIPGATTPNMANAVTTGHTSDALVLMSSGNGYGGIPLPVSTATAARLTVLNTTAFSGANINDLALLAQTDTSGGIANCMITQAALVTPTDGSATALPLGGSWYAATVSGQSVATYASAGVVVDLGDPSSTSTQPPSFQVVGVGDSDTLYSYDLLNVRTPQLQSRGQNVFELHALYGVDTNGDGVIDTWVSPSSGTYTVANLTAGTATASALIKSIKALRIGLILRTDLPEKNAVAATSSVKLFQSLVDADASLSGLVYTRTFSGAELNYRYRTVEATIPVRNNSF